jgi:ABC-type nickel/cobalt efflux system permease component RcnA
MVSPFVGSDDPTPDLPAFHLASPPNLAGMDGGSAKHRRHLTAAGWLVAGLGVVVAVGLMIGSQAVWIAALVLLLLILMGAFAIPRNVERLNVPPGMTNAPGDITKHEREDRD